MPPRLDRLASLALVALVLSACDLGGGDESALEGIYQISEWTAATPGDCDGARVDSPERGDASHFFVRLEEFLGAKSLTVVTCSDLETCRTMAADQATFYLGTFSFNEGDDAGGWTGEQVLLSNSEGTCSGTVDDTSLTGEEGASVAVERVTKEVSDVPLDDQDDCDLDAAYAQAADAPCTQRTVVAGEFLEAI